MSSRLPSGNSSTCCIKVPRSRTLPLTYPGTAEQSQTKARAVRNRGFPQMHEARDVHLGFAAPTQTISRPRSLPLARQPVSSRSSGAMRRSLHATRELPINRLSSLSQPARTMRRRPFSVLASSQLSTAAAHGPRCRRSGWTFPETETRGVTTHHHTGPLIAP